MARKTNAEAAGAKYATDQLASEYFADWVRDQMLEASQADPDTMLPLETKADAMVIAKNMLKQLEWDTKRELRGQELADLIGASSTSHTDIKEFFEGFRNTCDASRDWLADELLEIKGEMGGGAVEARRTGGTRGGPARKYYVVDQVQGGTWVQVGHFATKVAAEQFRAKLGGKTRVVHTFPGGHDHPPLSEEARYPKAVRSVRQRT